MTQSWRGCDEYTQVILSVVFERKTADLPQVNSFACFCFVILLKSNSIVMANCECVFLLGPAPFSCCFAG